MCTRAGCVSLPRHPAHTTKHIEQAFEVAPKQEILPGQPLYWWRSPPGVLRRDTPDVETTRAAAIKGQGHRNPTKLLLFDCAEKDSRALASTRFLYGFYFVLCLVFFWGGTATSVTSSLISEASSPLLASTLFAPLSASRFCCWWRATSRGFWLNVGVPLTAQTFSCASRVCVS